jgi:hypothetical protein
MYGDVKLVAICSKWTVSLALLLKYVVFDLLSNHCPVNRQNISTVHTNKASFFLHHERWNYGKHKVLSSETDTLQKAVRSHGRQKSAQQGRLRKLPLCLVVMGLRLMYGVLRIGLINNFRKDCSHTWCFALSTKQLDTGVLNVVRRANPMGRGGKGIKAILPNGQRG